MYRFVEQAENFIWMDPSDHFSFLFCTSLVHDLFQCLCGSGRVQDLRLWPLRPDQRRWAAKSFHGCWWAFLHSAVDLYAMCQTLMFLIELQSAGFQPHSAGVVGTSRVHSHGLQHQYSSKSARKKWTYGARNFNQIIITMHSLNAFAAQP